MYTNGQLSPLIKIKYFYSQFKNPVPAMSLKHLIVMNKYISHLPPLLTILAVKSGHSKFYGLPDKCFFFLWSLPVGVVSGKELLCRQWVTSVLCAGHTEGKR